MVKATITWHLYVTRETHQCIYIERCNEEVASNEERQLTTTLIIITQRVTREAYKETASLDNPIYCEHMSSSCRSSGKLQIPTAATPQLTSLLNKVHNNEESNDEATTNVTHLYYVYTTVHCNQLCAMIIYNV